MTEAPKRPDATPTLDLSGIMSEREWRVQREGLEAVRAGGVPFAVGGGIAVSALSGRWRYTHDLDLFVVPAHREAAIEAVLQAGFTDYFDIRPYDRGWIFRGHRNGEIIDLIWQMANYRAEVDEVWVTRGPEIALWSDRVRLLPPEELLWAKMYIVQRTRCDWPDLLNLLLARGPSLDWERLIDRVGPDVRLLAGLVATFSWLSPDAAQQLPSWLWGRLGVVAPPGGPDTTNELRRTDLFDSRDWFGPKQEAE